MNPHPPHPALTPSFAHLPLGKLEPRHDDRTLQLARYVDLTKLPPVPADYDLTAGVTWPMYGNDRLGDCTIAAAAHMIEAWTAKASALAEPPDSQVELAYWETGTPPAASGEPGGPTDTGRVELDVLNHWRSEGIAGHKIAAYAAVDIADPKMLMAATYLFGGAYLGIALPLTAQGQRTWTPVGIPVGRAAPGSWGGHAVNVAGYNHEGATVITWGAPLLATWRFLRVYGDEAYAIISPDWLNQEKTPDGFDLAALQADLAAITK